MSDLVIFDLDGVLVDTQDAENGALAYLGGLMGLTIGEGAAAELFSGRKMQECIDLMADMAGCAPPDGAMSIVRARCEELIGPSLEPVDGVADALARIPAPKCVASNSPREIIERRLRGAGVLHHFGGGIYSAYDVGAWKPDPRLFLWAASECGADASGCVVIEDSPVGVDAALEAGMRVLQFTPDPSAGPHREGVPTFSSMRRLPELLRAPAPFTPVTARDGGIR
ncbi:HAD family hydrolase [Sphaerisporangium album]|uniref:HAD family hydrolase n=1 Tax=Sphaerisporangium album TaxID=509200 RepID=A0A367F916_9ACTN|nr:HAD-IA family hydrolase [Sphaerisporangium album]RCG26195.1 HAD family hydrolase [Sphaerisporangium album]